MKELSINHVAFGSAILLHFMLLAFGAGLKVTEPEPQEQIAIRFTSVSERAEEPRREQAKPHEAIAQPQKTEAVPPPVQETRKPSVPAPALAPPQVPALHAAPQQASVQPAPPVQPVVQSTARSAAQAAAPPPASPMPKMPQEAGRSQSAMRGVPAARLPDYLNVVRSMVENNREYPAMARQLALQGTVTVRVSIRGDGSLSAVTVDVSSGHKALDKAAVSAVRRSAPFKPPAGFGLGEVTVEIPIVYRLT